MLPRIEAVVTADTQQGEAGLRRFEGSVERVEGAVARADTRTRAFGASMQAAAPKSRAFQFGVQNASFQINDFATQVGAGTAASVALGQQLPQLLQGFGVFGAVLGAVAAIAIPLSVAFGGMAQSGADLSLAFGTLAPLADTLASAMSSVAVAFTASAEALINNLDRIIIIAGTAATFFAGRWVASFVAARVATFSLAGALVTLRSALIRTGFGAVIVAAGELVYQFSRLVQAAGSLGEAFGLVFQVAKEAFMNIDIMGQGLWDALRGVALSIQAAFISAFAAIAQRWQALVNGMAKAWNSIAGSSFGQGIGLGMLDASSVGTDLQGAADGLRARAADAFASSAGSFNAAMPSLKKIRGLLKSIKDDRITLPDLLGVGGGDEDGSGGGGGGGGGRQSAATKALDEELTAQENRIAEHFQRITALTQGGLSDKLGAWSTYFGNLAALTGTNNQKLLSIQKAFAASQALIDAWRAHNAVLADPTLPWWARLASAGQVFAAGIGAVNAIKSVGSSGSTSSSRAASSGGSAASATPVAATQNVTEVRFLGSLGASGQQLVDLINGEFDRGNYVRAVVG